MKRLGAALGNKRFAILGDKTLAECAALQAEKWRQGRGQVWPYGPGRGEGPMATPASDVDEAAELHQHLERCGLPSRLAAVIEADHRETPGISAVRLWLATGKSLLMLHGDPGSGKSVAAASAFLSAKRNVRWIGGESSAWDSLGCVWESAWEASRVGLFGPDSRRYWEHLGAVRLLVLDDLGAELTNEAWQACLDGLLAERFGNAELRTVITTNVSAKRPGADKPSAFELRYGARIARRIRESGSVVALEKLTQEAT